MSTLYDELLVCLRSGDERSYTKLVSALHEPAWMYAKSIVIHPFSAHEIINEVFLKLWMNRNQLVIKSSIRSYFFRMIHNHCCDYLRKNKQFLGHDFISIDDIESRLEIFEISEPETYFDKIFSEELETAFKIELEKLPQKCREIFILCRFKQMTYPEIAKQLNISLSTVKTQMIRAMARLKDALKDYL
jgi:RNA polymerase sigma-70 factor (ECF subfamily)